MRCGNGHLPNPGRKGLTASFFYLFLPNQLRVPILGAGDVQTFLDSWQKYIQESFMGGSHSHAEQGQQDLKEFELKQYGGKVLVDQERGVVVKTLSVPAEEENQFLEVMEKRRKLQHPNLARFFSLEAVEVGGGALCTGPSHTFKLQYQLLTHSVFNQIQRHCQLRKPIPEPEVCRIFQGVVKCLQYLQRNGTLHGDIKVSSIFLDKQREVKLIDSFLLKHGRTNYQVVLEDPQSMSLLSPEQLQLLRIKWFDSLQRSGKNEMFMVGLSMLEVTTIREGMKCYNLDSLTINEPFFQRAMQDIIDSGYSRHLSNLIMTCVHKDPSQRPSFSQFLTAIQDVNPGRPQSSHLGSISNQKKSHPRNTLTRQSRELPWAQSQTSDSMVLGVNQNKKDPANNRQQHLNRSHKISFRNM